MVNLNTTQTVRILLFTT